MAFFNLEKLMEIASPEILKGQQNLLQLHTAIRDHMEVANGNTLALVSRLEALEASNARLDTIITMLVQQARANREDFAGGRLNGHATEQTIVTPPQT
jgi:hypothetical protein